MKAGAAGEIYAALRSIRDRYAHQIRGRFPQIPRRVSGYNLDQLLPENGFNVARALVGTEGTCAIVLEATLRLIDSPPHRTLVGLGYTDAFAAADHVPAILDTGPIGLEGFEGGIVDGLQHKGAPNLDLLPQGRGILLVEYGSNDPAEGRASADRLVERLSRTPTAPAHGSTPRPRPRRSGRFASRVRAPHRPSLDRFRGGKDGTTPRSHPNGSARICAICASC